MKLRAKANGNIVDVPDGEGEALLASGIYEPLEESTAVEPLTTASVPKQAKQTLKLMPKKKGK